MSVNKTEMINQIATNSGLKGKELQDLKLRLAKMSENDLKLELTSSLSGMKGANKVGFKSFVQENSAAKTTENVWGSGFVEESAYKPHFSTKKEQKLQRTFTPLEKTNARAFLTEYLKQEVSKTQDIFNDINNNRTIGNEGAMELQEVWQKVSDFLKIGGTTTTRGNIQDFINNERKDIVKLEANKNNEKRFNQTFKRMFGKDVDYGQIIDYLQAVENFDKAPTKAKLSKSSKETKALFKTSKNFNELMKGNFTRNTVQTWVNKTGNEAGLVDLGVNVALMYGTGGGSMIANATQKATIAGENLGKTIVGKYAQTQAGQTLSKSVGIVNAQATGAALNATAFQTTHVADALSDGKISSDEISQLNESAMGLFKFGYVGSALTGPLGAKAAQITSKTLKSEPVLKQILKANISENPTTLSKVVAALGKNEKSIAAINKFGVEFGGNLTYMAESDGTSFGEAAANLGQMDAVSKMVVAMMGGKNSKFLTPERINKVKSTFENTQIQIKEDNGKKFYELTSPDGKKTKLANPRELLMFIEDQAITPQKQVAQKSNTKQSKNKAQTEKENDILSKLETCNDAKVMAYVESQIQKSHSANPREAAILLEQGEALIDAINVKENNYSMVGSDVDMYYKNLRKGNKNIAEILANTSSKEPANTKRPALYDKNPYALESQFKTENRNAALKEYITKFGSKNSEMSNYLYEKYYISELSPKAQNACREVQNKFGTKLFVEDGSSPYSANEVQKEFSEWKKAGGSKVKFPPVLDMSEMKAYAEGADGYYKPQDGSIGLAGDKVSTIRSALRHEMVHLNDNVLNSDINYAMEEKFQSTITNKEVESNFAAAGLNKGQISAAMDSRQELIGTASEGDYTKFTAEFQKKLVDLGMPEYFFKIKPKDNSMTVKGSFVPTFKGIEKITPEQKLDVAYNIEKIYSNSKAGSKQAISQFHNTFKGIDGIDLSARVKNRQGMEEKLYRKLLKFDDKMTKLQAQLPSATPEEKAKIQKAIDKIQLSKISMTTNYSAMKNTIADAMGTRLIMKSTTPETVQKVVDRLVKGVENNEFIITELNNYGGTPENTYFSKAQEEALKLACAKKGIALDVISPTTNPKEGIKASGYTSCQMNIVYKNGVIGELQIRGSMMHELAEAEHIRYDLDQHKDLSKGDARLKAIVDPFVNAFNEMKLPKNKELQAKYDNYVKDYYIYTRAMEENKNIPPVPQLPEGIPDILSVENMLKIHEEIIKK